MHPLPEGSWKTAVKFLTAGGIRTAALYALYVGLVYAGLHYNLALILDYILGALTGYLVNRFWTFASHGRTYRSFPKYCASCGILYLINLISLNLIVRHGFLDVVFGQVVSLGVTTVINFLLLNFWVFRSKRVPLLNKES